MRPGGHLGVDLESFWFRSSCASQKLYCNVSVTKNSPNSTTTNWFGWKTLVVSWRSGEITHPSSKNRYAHSSCRGYLSMSNCRLFSPLGLPNHEAPEFRKPEINICNSGPHLTNFCRTLSPSSILGRILERLQLGWLPIRDSAAFKEMQKVFYKRPAVCPPLRGPSSLGERPKLHLFVPNFFKSKLGRCS